MEQKEEPRKGHTTEDDEDGTRRIYAVAEDWLKESADFGAKTEADTCGQLYDAVYDGEFEKVKEILCWDDKSKEKVEYRKWYVNEKSWLDWRPLHAAAEAGYLELSKFLLECGAVIDLQTVSKETALILATDRGHTEIVKLLLENGANFMISTEAGLHGTALHSAAAKGRLECVRLLTEVPGHEELVNELGGDNCTALYYAACAGNQEVAKILLEKGGKKTIDTQDSNGQTALHLAIMTGNLDFVKFLVEVGGASTTIADINGQTPAIFAKKKCKMQIMTYLNSL